jgi:hypothetical protein
MNYRVSRNSHSPRLWSVAILELSFLLIASPVVLAESPASSQAHTDTEFARALISKGPSPQLPKAAAAVYDWLIGDWEADVYDFEPGGKKRVDKGEWHFRWVLEGRAVQDVWIVPIRPSRVIDAPTMNNRYGTSLRTYDPKLDVWHVFWVNPVTQDRSELIARKIGNTVVQQGIAEDGSFMRWTFRDITATSFTWRGELSSDGGKTWQLDAEFVVRRIVR